MFYIGRVGTQFEFEVMSTGYKFGNLPLTIKMMTSINSSRGICSSLVRASLGEEMGNLHNFESSFCRKLSNP